PFDCCQSFKNLKIFLNKYLKRLVRTQENEMGKFSASSLVSHHSFPPIFFLMAMEVLDMMTKTTPIKGSTLFFSYVLLFLCRHRHFLHYTLLILHKTKQEGSSKETSNQTYKKIDRKWKSSKGGP
ncbi:hypothetical protein PanWU01x14_002620, partial [Parasponia andersonii]